MRAIMGRRRIIDPEALLDAAERVVRREGAVNLTISAVAAEAGVSKATVLYDFRTKQALIAAVVARRLAADEARLRACIAEAAADPSVANPELAGRLRFAATQPEEQDLAAALTLCVAMASDDAVRGRIREFIRRDLAAFAPGCAGDPAPLMAFLALHGYLSLKYFDLYTFPPEVRDVIFASVAQMARTQRTTCDGQ
ncbi:TetR family transcriptional regulator [Camelimonas abortus]|uniref:TetR family transcriptional regulator n=1 Tax=Camelimonas abortus TaxID=1017184 RepID=A0ABV7LAD3_9HYPH